jgi:hypothetical protein
MGAKRNLRDRAAAASEKDDRPRRPCSENGIKKALRERQDALGELVDAVRLYRKLADSKPLTLQGSDYVEAVERLNAAIDRADGLVSA